MKFGQNFRARSVDIARGFGAKIFGRRHRTGKRRLYKSTKNLRCVAEQIFEEEKIRRKILTFQRRKRMRIFGKSRHRRNRKMHGAKTKSEQTKPPKIAKEKARAVLISTVEIRRQHFENI